MKLKIVNRSKTETGNVELPLQFNEPLRTDVINKVFKAKLSNARQKYGAKPEAGKRASAELSRRRRKYRGSYGIGISRVPRKILSRRGTRMNWVGAFAPGTVGGRRAHPPKSEKNWDQKINKKENRLAIRSALGATLNVNTVSERGHKLPSIYPFILESKAESIEKTGQVRDMLKKLGFENELERTNKKTIRSGKGKMRNRKYQRKIGPLIVTADVCPLLKAARNISGVNATTVKNLNIKQLAPGAKAGRLTVFTESAIEKLKKDNLFSA